MAAANRRCGPPENYPLLMKYSCPVPTFFSVAAMKSRSVILRIEGEGFREQRRATRPGQGQRGGTRHTCHRIIGDWQPPWCEATGIARSQDEDPKPEDGRALQRPYRAGTICDS
jgi:hypothetical protein